jgi:hypothetical protein
MKAIKPLNINGIEIDNNYVDHVKQITSDIVTDLTKITVGPFNWHNYTNELIELSREVHMKSQKAPGLKLRTLDNVRGPSLGRPNNNVTRVINHYNTDGSLTSFINKYASTLSVSVYIYLDTNDKRLLESPTNTGIPLVDICTSVIKEHLLFRINKLKDSDTPGNVEEYLKGVAKKVPRARPPVPVPWTR